MLHVTTHSKGTKMEGIQSVSTLVTLNPICQSRRCVPGSICEHCYAHNLTSFRKTLREALAKNTILLSSGILEDEEFPIISTMLGRVEAFGDVSDVTAARNYIRLERLNPRVDFAIWSKNDEIWYQAFLLEGKPENTTYVHSSMEVDKVDEIPERYQHMVDHVFTVWSKKRYAEFRGTKSECAGIRCLSCKKCYKRGGIYYINEELR